MNFDIIKYDAGDIRNKSIMLNITKYNMSDKNIISCFEKKKKDIILIMDEIDGMNNGDKGGISSLIKLIRPKKTKKQKKEEYTLNPIVCISNYHVDKKIKELIKVCHSFELKEPTDEQVRIILNNLNIKLKEKSMLTIIKYINGDIRKINEIYKIYIKYPKFFEKDKYKNIFEKKIYQEDSKLIVNKLYNNNYEFNQHNYIINDTDRTTVGLLWHENIPDVFINNNNKKDVIKLYNNILSNFCYSDYVDRITFQKQIWQLNEMSSLIKLFYNNKLLHNSNLKKKKLDDIRFTKILTKYSTEYNNITFIKDMCQKMMMDKKDLFHYFYKKRCEIIEMETLYSFFSNHDISKLEVNRIYRFIDNYIK
tara:strand:- start:289 stop:1383 length:1095 start_codon:yes stop_codon:yes gene_type:complete